MPNQQIFAMGDRLLIVTIERQSILINDELAGFVEVLHDREKTKSEARIWLYPEFRSYAAPVRRWIESSQGPQIIREMTPAGADVTRQPVDTTPLSMASGWSVGFRADRRYGYEVYLTDRITGFLYPVHGTRSRRDAFAVKRQVENDLQILSDDAFAEKWGLQRIAIRTNGQ